MDNAGRNEAKRKVSKRNRIGRRAIIQFDDNPEFGIGQSAYLIQEPGFNLLWDCITYLDQRTIENIERMGGVQAIALSHPHYYAAQTEWAEMFDAPIYIHEDDKQWVQRPSSRIVFWSGDSLKLSSGLTLHRLGGHFKGERSAIGQTETEARESSFQETLSKSFKIADG